jgi:hypothetical protein
LTPSDSRRVRKQRPRHTIENSHFPKRPQEMYRHDLLRFVYRSGHASVLRGRPVLPAKPGRLGLGVDAARSLQRRGQVEPGNAATDVTCPLFVAHGLAPVGPCFSGRVPCLSRRADLPCRLIAPDAQLSGNSEGGGFVVPTAFRIGRKLPAQRVDTQRTLRRFDCQSTRDRH